MKRLWGKVTEVTSQRAGISELLVSVEGREGQARAICYPDLTGQVQVGERVLLNTTALDLKLGTGGAHFVIAAADDAASDTAIDPAAGHLMKLRYTPHQINVLSVEAPESVHHRIMERRDSLEGVPVVCCGLHSQVPL
ncbi:MAG: DUF3866 family protein, partial [Coriobacteriia bacterium]|nr:DUF3866 family protein [Coriobacteriia bacterium]